MTINDKPRTEQLLEISKRRDLSYQSQLTGEKVSTSIIQRMEQGTPLNHIEEAFFTWFSENVWFIEKLVCKYAEAAMKKRDRWSLAPVWERARWDSIIDLGQGEGDYKVNDHHRSYLSRVLNEMYNRPFFMTRTVKGEEESYTDYQWEEKFGSDPAPTTDDFDVDALMAEAS